MDDERLKSGGSVLTQRYFEEQLERVREFACRSASFTRLPTFTPRRLITTLTAADGKSYATQHFKRSATIAVVCKVNSRRAVLFLVNLASSPTAGAQRFGAAGWHKPAQGHQHNKNSQTRKNQGASE